ncbi:MAG: DUF2079 domain-containing protein, partial [Cyanobacteria bacterium J06648_11]
FQRFWVACIVISLLYVPVANSHRTFYFAIPDSVNPWVYVAPVTQWQRTREMNQLIAQIAPEESVSASNTMIPHLSGRRVALRLPIYSFTDDRGKTKEVDAIVVDFWRLNRYQIAFKRDRQYLIDYKQLVNQLLARQEYGAIAFRNGVVLLRQNQPSDPDALRQWQQYATSELREF